MSTVSPKKRRLSIEFLPEIDEQITALCQQKGMPRSKVVEVLVLLGLGCPAFYPEPCIESDWRPSGS